MSKLVLLLFAALAVVACDNAGKPVPVDPGSNTSGAVNSKPQTAVAHTTENQQPKADNGGSKSGWTSGGDPIDTTALDSAIKDAEKALAAKPSDASAKKALAAAYLKRATALTDARQYASALGDYRRVLKHDPDNAEAKQWITQITSIYDSMNKKYPAEGEEPPPLPFKKES